MAQARDELRAAALDALAEPEHRDDDVLAAELEVDVVAVAHAARDLVAADAGAADVHAHPQRVDRRDAEGADQALVEDLEAGDARGWRARTAASSATACSSSSAPCSTAWRRAASSDASSRLLGLVEETSRRAWSMPPSSKRAPRAEVQHRRLGEAAGVLVRARDDEVGAGGQGVLGQGIAEGQVRAPRLVDDQRHAVRVGDARQAADVGHGAEVRG